MEWIVIATVGLVAAALIGWGFLLPAAQKEPEQEITVIPVLDRREKVTETKKIVAMEKKPEPQPQPQPEKEPEPEHKAE